MAPSSQSLEPPENPGRFSVDIVGSLSDINEALLNALILRMAKAQVTAEAADKELGKQVQQESSDLLAANDDQVAKVVNA